MPPKDISKDKTFQKLMEGVDPSELEAPENSKQHKNKKKKRDALKELELITQQLEETALTEEPPADEAPTSDATTADKPPGELPPVVELGESKKNTKRKSDERGATQKKKPVAAASSDRDSGKPSHKEKKNSDKRNSSKREPNPIQKKDSDEELLDALAREHGYVLDEGADRTLGATESSYDSASPENAAQILRLLTAADLHHTNYRDELQQAFGLSALEDYSGAALKQRGIILPKLRRGVFITPNLGGDMWHVIGHKGADLTSPLQYIASGARGSQKPIIFFLNTNTESFRRAEAAFEFTQGVFPGDVRKLVELWSSHVRHLPLLLQLQSSFSTIGDVAHSNEFTEIILHVIGGILAGSGTAAAAATAGKNAGTTTSSLTLGLGLDKGSPLERVLPHTIPANRIIHHGLARGVHYVLKKGCAKTALELTRVLLSLDTDDPEALGIVMDYCALRGREWAHLVELQHRLINVGFTFTVGNDEGGTTATNEASKAEDTEPDFSSSVHPFDNLPLGFEYVGLPSLHFNAALARFMYSTSIKGDDEKKLITAKGSNRSPLTPFQDRLLMNLGGTKSNGSDARFSTILSRTITSSQSLTADDAMALAVALFPEAATALATELNQSMDNSPWIELSFAVEDVTRRTFADDGAYASFMRPYAQKTSQRLHTLFVLRSKDMWRAPAHIELLRRGAHMAVKENLIEVFHAAHRPSPAPDSDDTENTQWYDFSALIRRLHSTKLHDRYASTADEIATGAYSAAIPQEVLEAAMVDDGQEALVQQQEHGLAGRLTTQQEELLARYEAAFGPLSPSMSIAERMAAYEERLESHVHAIGNEHTAVSLFLRSLLPWNDIHELALRRAFEEAGVEDPAVVARRLHRRYVEQVSRDADNGVGPDDDSDVDNDGEQ